MLKKRGEVWREGGSNEGKEEERVKGEGRQMDKGKEIGRGRERVSE